MLGRANSARDQSATGWVEFRDESGIGGATLPNMRRERNKANAELSHKRREKLLRSLRSPHPESGEAAELGLSDWLARASEDDVAGLLDPAGGIEVRWQPGEGWIEIEP